MPCISLEVRRHRALSSTVLYEELEQWILGSRICDSCVIALFLEDHLFLFREWLCALAGVGNHTAGVGIPLFVYESH